MTRALRLCGAAALLAVACSLNSPAAVAHTATSAPAPSPSIAAVEPGYENTMPLPGGSGNGNETTFVALLALSALGGAATWALRSRRGNEDPEGGGGNGA